MGFGSVHGDSTSVLLTFSFFLACKEEFTTEITEFTEEKYLCGPL
jgi:hypothetical protein